VTEIGELPGTGVADVPLPEKVTVDGVAVTDKVVLTVAVKVTEATLELVACASANPGPKRSNIAAKNTKHFLNVFISVFSNLAPFC
jgi:hypothetical protein